MPDNLLTVDVPLSPAQALQLNDVCDRFEVAWKAVAPDMPGPRIEEFLAEAASSDHSVLLRHLILLDVDYRRLRGEQPTVAEYEARFSSCLGRLLNDAFPEDAAQKPVAENDAVRQIETTVLPPSFQPQLRSERYVVGQFHARGGIGEIWMAKDAEIGRTVALKRLRPQREALKDRFLVEAQVTGQLEHPGIVPVHDLGIDEEGRPFYVMSFIHGRTLKDAIEEYQAGSSSSKEPREVQGSRLLENFVKVCQAVAYAHHRGVVHRDLKPENVMLGPFGEVLVLDWGMAKVRGQSKPERDAPQVQLTYSSGSTPTQHGQVLGSPVYMAPEMADGRAADADEQTDVYLLGATLYHLLTGQPPRQGSSHDEIIELARSVPPPSPRRLKADIPRALEAICLKAMAHRKERRYASALELAQDMERYLAGAPVSAYHEPVPVRVWRWCKRHRRALVRALAGVAVLALIGVGVALIHDAWNQQEAARLKAEAEVRDAQSKAAADRQEADKLRRRRKALDDLKEFRGLADERQFRAASTTPAGESAMFYDASRGHEIGEKAVALAAQLAPELNDLELETERVALHQELHALLLLVIQGESLNLRDSDQAKAILARLAQALSLGGSSRTTHRLQARCYRVLGEEKRAAEEEQSAQTTTPTALDHFLEAEECRARAGFGAEPKEDRLAWQANPELLRQAVQHYHKALEAEPKNFWCHLQLGRCYLSLGQGAEALAALDTCVALHPDKPWGYSARGLVRGLVKDYTGGEADLERASAIDPGFRPAQLHRGILAWLQRKDEQALADFTAIQKPPAERQMIEAVYYRGQLYLQRMELQNALADFDQVVKANVTFRPVYLVRAQVHFLRGDDLRGLTDLATFLDLGGPKPLDPKDPQLPALRGRLLLQLVPKWRPPRDVYVAKLKLAQAELEKAKQADVRSAELFDDLGSVAERLGEWDKALDAYEQSLKLAPPPNLAVKVRTKRGWIYAQSLKSPRYDKAAADFTAALGLDIKHADAHAGLGYVQALQGLPAEAHRSATLALTYAPQHTPNNYLLLHNVACIYAQMSQVDKQRAKQQQDLALDLFRRADELCRRGEEGDNEIRNIRQEKWLLKVLGGRPEFNDLVNPKRR